MSGETYKVRSEVCLYPGMAGWHFAYVSEKQSGEIKKKFGKLVKGWGSIPVTATFGKTSWKTSIFPDKKSGTYLLPLKAQIRKKEGITAGEVIAFSLEIGE